MARLCIFIHYFPKNFVPLYVQIYLHELAKHFDEIIVVTNARPLENREKLAAYRIIEVTNEGYDLGMFYKAFQTLDLEKYATIACVNDSNILLAPLDNVMEWASEQTADFWGILDADVRPSYATHADVYHIQSHFIIFNKAAINLLPAYFAQLNWTELFAIKHAKTLKQQVINFWEIGVSQYLIQQGMQPAAFLSSRAFHEQKQLASPHNLLLTHYPDLLALGIPLLKKRIVTSANLKHVFAQKNHWKSLIKRFAAPQWPIAALIKELDKLRFSQWKAKIKAKIS